MNPFDQFDAPAANPFDQFDKPAAPGVTLKDLGVSLKQGVERVPGQLAGLADIPLGLVGLDRPASKAADLVGEVTGFQPGKWAKEADAQHSPGYHAQQKALGEAWDSSGANELSRALLNPEQWDKLGGLWNQLDGPALAKTIAQNPGAVGAMTLESLPGMVAGGAIGRGIKAGAGALGAETLAGDSALGVATRAGIGEGAITAGQAMSQIDPSVDPQTAAGASLAAGGITGLIGGASGRLATKLGLPDIEMAMAGGRGGSSLSIAKRLPASMLQEGVLEELPQSMQEQVWQNAAEGKPLGEGVLRQGVEGMLSGMATAGAFSAMPQRAPAGPLTEAAMLSPVAQAAPSDVNPFDQFDGGAVPMAAASKVPSTPVAQADAVAPLDGGVVPPPTNPVAPGTSAIWRNQDFDLPVEVLQIMPRPGLDGRQYAKVRGVIEGAERVSFVPLDELTAGGDKPVLFKSQPEQAEAGPVEVPEQAASAPAAGPGIDLAQLFTEQNPVPLKNAHRIVRMFRSQGSEQAVIPSPTGKGFGVAPLAQLSQDQRASFAKFQPKGGIEGVMPAAGAPQLPADPAKVELLHVEGAQVEPATVPTIDQSLAQTGKPLGTARSWLVAQIDKALATPTDPAPIAEYQALMAQVADARRVAALKKTKPGEAQMRTVWADKTEAETLPALRDRIGYVTFDVPGDGKFKVLNTPEHLEQFRTRVKGSKGFTGLPAPVETPANVDVAASRADTAPTDGQKEAGNYAKGHFTVGGLKVAIESPAGSSRSGTDPDGKPWISRMSAHYGYLKRTTGADGDQVDVYVKPGTQMRHSGPVFVADQYDPATGAFDEHKVLMGYGNQAEAAKAYDAHFGDKSGPKRRGAVTRLTLDAFKQWLASGDTKKPLSSKKASTTAPAPELSTDDPYAQLDTRPGTTDRQRTAGRNALRDILGRVNARLVSRRIDGKDRPAVSLLGAGLAQGFTQSGGVQLTGQRVETAADLAALAQVFRDPRFETFRVFYTQGGTVVGEAGYSSRLPAAVFMPMDLDEQIAKDKDAFKADGFWILHNHPSGRSQPSVSDVSLTRSIAGQVPGFQGHVVIDHNEYSTVAADGATETIKAPELAGFDFHAQPELEHELLGVKIDGPQQVTHIAKALQIEGGHASVVLTRRQGQVQLLVDLPAAALKDNSSVGRLRLKSALRRLSRAVGAGGNSFVVLPAGAEFKGLYHLVTDGIFTDVVAADGRSMRGEGTFFPGSFLDEKTKDAMRVAEEEEGATPPRATLRDWIRHQLKQNRGWALGALTRDQLADIYGRTMPQVNRFDRVVQRMDVTRNQIAEKADALVERWRKLPAEMADRLADVMHAATLAQYDPDKEGPSGPEQIQITRDWQALTPEAHALYRDVRDQYRATLMQIRGGLSARAERAGEGGRRIATQIRLQFDKYLAEGPYFSLARFGDFVLIADKGEERLVEAFESSLKREMRQRALQAQGWTTKATARREYSVSRDGAASRFVGDVLERIAGLDMNPKEKAALIDGLNQLAISLLPDSSYRKHFHHRKGTPGFSNDAMRAFASAQQHAAHHIARINHADELSTLLDEMQDEIRAAAGGDMTERQQVVNELTRRLDMLMNPNTHPVTAALGQVGFVMSLGGSVASGVTNLTQTPLVTFPFLGVRFGFDKAAAALTQAAKDYFGGRWDKWSGFVMQDNPKLTQDEQGALRQLEKAGLINLTQAHDLAGAANTDSTHSQRAFAINRAMKIIGWTFHLPEVFNRQVSALAAYRLARAAGQDGDAALEAARQALIRTHFDYSASNRARLMVGNVTRVLTMFKQYSQNVTYLLWRNAHQALQGESAEVRREARRMLLGVAAMHFAAAGAMGLPLGVFGVSPLLSLLAMGMGGADDPWDWEAEFRNMLADTFGTDLGEAIAHGPLRLISNVDFASRVGLGDLWIRAPQKEAEGRDLVEAWMLTLLGPVAGYLGNLGTAAKAFDEGKFSRGVEALMPKMISAPVKALRYEQDGVRSWKGDALGVELSAADLLGTAAGFQPSRLAEMFEGRAAVKGREVKLQNRREELVNAWVAARLAGDAQGVREAMVEAMQFSRSNRPFAITPENLNQALQAKRRAQQHIHDGYFLSRKHEPLREVGRFANVGG